MDTLLCVPSWNIRLNDVLQPSTRLYVFRAPRIEDPICTAQIERVDDTSVVLLFDSADLARGDISVGTKLHLGFGRTQQGMLYASLALVTAVCDAEVTIDYPGPLVKVPRRAYTRAALTLDFGVKRHDGEETRWMSLNMSAGGALLVARDKVSALTAGETISVSFAIPDWRHIAVHARVIRTYRHSDLRAIAAIQFLDMEEADEFKIQLRVLRAVKRRSLRYPVKVTGRLELNGESIRCETVNLSGSGALLRPLQETQPARAGIHGSLVLEPKSAPALRIDKFAVVRVQLLDGESQLAVEFSEMGDEQRLRLIEFVMEEATNV